MNWLDIVIIIILAISVLIGVKTGLVKMILSIAGLILGIYLAGMFYLQFADVLGFLPRTAAEIAAFVIIVIVVMIIAAIVAYFLDKLLHAILLGWLNHLLGGIGGLVLGGIVVAMALVLWAKYAGGSDAISGSALGSFLVDKLPLVLNLLPADFGSVKQFFQ
jgi:membrane protein required for colicin V production